jgi:parallel beta-helix repeat protein
VGTDTVLTGNLECSNGPGLIVGADGITIDLGNKMISCLGSPLACQGNSLAVGIDVGSHKNVTINGPGKIDGFDTGIKIDGGDRVTIKGLTVTGPPANFFAVRGTATGILVENVGCPGTILIDGNDVSWHRFGIRLVKASCVKIQRNIVHWNNNGGTEAFGILLSGASGNTITNNTVTENGYNNSYDPTTGAETGLFDAGIALAGFEDVPGVVSVESTGNRISQNTVDLNCGDGIAARIGAMGNTISNNAAFNNPQRTPGSMSSCAWPSPTTIVNSDLAARDPLADNRWSKTNDCWTQFGPIPIGVCNPGE